MTVNGVTVTTTGTINPATGDHSQALYNGDGTHTGTSPTGGGVANVTNSTFQTHGVDSIGVDTLDGGTTTLSGGSVSTSGVMSAGVVSDSSAFVSLTGVSVTTTGNGATGLGVNGGAELDALNATVVTQGGVDPNSGDHAYGAYNGPSGPYTSGGVLKLTDTSMSTQGVQMFGVFTGAAVRRRFSAARSRRRARLPTLLKRRTAAGRRSASTESGAATAISTTGPSATGVVAYNGGVVQLDRRDDHHDRGRIDRPRRERLGFVADGDRRHRHDPGRRRLGDRRSRRRRLQRPLWNLGLRRRPLADQLQHLDQRRHRRRRRDFHGGATSLTGGSIKTTGPGIARVNAYDGGAVTLSGTTIATSGMRRRASRSGSRIVRLGLRRDLHRRDPSIPPTATTPTRRL